METTVAGRGACGQRLRRDGVRVFVELHLAVLGILLLADFWRNPNHLQGYPFAAVLVHLGLTIVWFFLSRAGLACRWMVLLTVVTADVGLVGLYARDEDGAFSLGYLVGPLVCSAGLWAGPLIAMMGTLRRAGLRVVALEHVVNHTRPKWSLASPAAIVGVVLYVGSFVLLCHWFEWERMRPLSQEDMRNLLVVQAVFIGGALLIVIGVFAALCDRNAPLWFGILALTIAMRWLFILAGYAYRGDLNWKRVYRDASAALLGFVPYLHLLWIRAVGYRVAFTAA